MKGSYLMGRGWSVPSGTGSATSWWKELLCAVWEENRKTGSELLCLLPGQDFTCGKGSFTWLSGFSSQVCLFLLSFCFLCTWSSHSCPISLCTLLASASQAKLPISLQFIAFEVCLPVVGFWWRLQQRTAFSETGYLCPEFSNANVWVHKWKKIQSCTIFLNAGLFQAS